MKSQVSSIRKMATTAVTDSAKSLESVLSDYENRTYSHFVLKYSDKKFFEDDLEKLPEVNSRQRLLWSLSAVTDKGLVLPFTGVPFLFLGNRTLACHHGPDLNRSTKIKQRDIRAQRHSPSSPKRRFLVQPTKKMDCPVVIHMKKIVSFPDYKIDVDSEYARRCTGKQLKEALAIYEARHLAGEKKPDLKMKLEYYILLPDPMTHENHVLRETQGIVEPWRGRKKKTSGVTATTTTIIQNDTVSVDSTVVASVASVVDILESSAANDIDLTPNFESCLKNLVYYENAQAMAMLLIKSKLAMRYSKIDQAIVSQLAIDLQQECHDIYFMPTAVVGEADIQLGYLNQSDWEDEEDIECKLEVPNADLMFVYQSADMKRLYRRYGNQMVVLDAMYRSGRYPLPVFFLLVRTNVSYQIVAVFAIQHETVQAVARALFVIKNWSPDVSPKYAMVDSSNEEILALEQTFPGIFVYICDYHRECSWNNWIAKPENGLTLDADNVKGKLKKIANAITSDEVSRAVTEFETSPQFTCNRRLSSWFHNRWKPLLTKWSAAYRGDGEFMLAVLTNNGVKRMNEDFKYSFLATCQQLSLSELMRLVIRQVLPGEFRTYVDLNVRSSILYRRYNEDVPVYLRNRPRRLIDYMRKKIASVDNTILSDIQTKSDGVFLVPASSGQPPFEVCFGSESACCSCTCVSFQRTRLLCKHFCAVFAAVPEWTFEKVSPVYSNNPVLLLDEEVLARQVDPFGVPASDVGQIMDFAGNFNEPSAVLDGVSEVARKRSVRVVSEAGRSRFQLKNERTSARRILKKLLDLTYSVNEASTINSMRRQLETIHRTIKKTAESQVSGDLPVVRTTSLKTPAPVSRKPKFCRLAKRVGRKKEKFSECKLEISVMNNSENGDANVSTTYVTLVTSDLSVS